MMIEAYKIKITVNSIGSDKMMQWIINPQSFSKSGVPTSVSVELTEQN
uniref:Uncharacterized protein n=1 Tax=Arundo donax TaxID=35708 RepID=A0A0A9CCV2_ARUDO